MMIESTKLKCDKCFGNLSGRNNSTIYFCLSCGRGCDVSGEAKVFYNLQYALPEKKQDLPMEYFPFWHIKCEFVVENTSDMSRLEGKDDFLIPAFFIKNINYFGDIGLFYMQKEIKPQYSEKLDIPVFPADRGLGDASKYPFVYLMKEYSKKIGAEFLNIKVKKTGTDLILIPFYKKGHSYYDSFLFWKYPSGALI